MRLVRIDAYLEEELYDILTYNIQNPNASDFESKKKRIEEIGRELYNDGVCQAISFMVEQYISRMELLMLVILSDVYDIYDTQIAKTNFL